MLVNESLFHPFSRAACRAALLLLLLLRGMVSYAGGDEGIPFTQNGIPLRGISQVTLPGGIIESNAFEDEAEIICQYQPNGESSVTIQNVIMLKFREEAPEYIATNGSVSVDVDITYGSSSGATAYISRTLTVSYNKEAGSGYKAADYVKIEGWAYVKVKIKDIAITGFGSLNVSKVLQLENNILARRYYTFNHSIKPSFLTASFNGDPADALDVSWSWASFPGNNFTQLEWTWVEDDFNAYYNASNRFQNNATRIDLPGNVNSYSLPLYYDGDGYLYYRVRAVSINATGSRTDGAWSDVQSIHYGGHNNNLNWQVTTSFAEEGKRKTVMQYYDGSLRGRQTVTKDNSTHQTVTAETMYDGQGRPAVQILPAPGSDLVIKYNPNFNLFNQQAENENPANHFDLEPLVSGEMLTLKQDRGAALYYSTLNPEKNSGNNVFLPDADGYAYTHTRYTPDGTGRVLSQSGVGETFKSGGEHETRYYYGTAAQEELDGLFGTEAGTASHYFKNMVRDANGQMSVSYVDMHGRTIATALTGESPENLSPLNITDTNLYYNQAKRETIRRSLLDRNNNLVKNNSIESINTLLVPFETIYHFEYELEADTIQVRQCNGQLACYSCLYDLNISIADESGKKGIKDSVSGVYDSILVKNFDNIDQENNSNCQAPFVNGPHISDNKISFYVRLKEGSYSIRKTLTINDSAFQAFRNQYYAQGCDTLLKEIFDSVRASIETASGCAIADTTDACEACLDSLGTYSSYRTRYLAGMGANIPAEAVIRSAYITDSLHCEKLCNVVSQRLRAIRQAMLADMRPYSGQYAQHPGSSTFVNEAGVTVTLGGAMHQKYNIFSTLYNAGQQPWFKKPRDRQGNAYEYRDEMSLRDTINHELAGISHQDFSAQFKFSWAESLLPHHPEYAKLKYAEDNLQASYNWIEGFNRINTYSAAATAGYNANPQNSDIFFSGPGSGLKITMDSIVGARPGNSWHKGINLWQMAYGNVMCNNTFSPNAQEDCYTSAPIVPGSGYSSLTDAQKDAVWNGFKNLYMVVRDSMVNAYLNGQVTVTDAASLLEEKFILRFPSNNSQIASQYNWSWLPSSGVHEGETLPGIDLEDSLDAHYASRCGAYIDQWKRTLLQCEQLNGKLNKEAIIADITSRMEALCSKGTDEANPYGSSTLPAGTAMPNGDESFEQIIEDVLNANSISKTEFCNPYGISFPKPYGTGRPISKQYVSLLDTCTCQQFQVIKDSAYNAGYSPYNLYSLNNYLRNKYNDTLTAELFEGLQNCIELGVIHCSGGGTSGMLAPADKPGNDPLAAPVLAYHENLPQPGLGAFGAGEIAGTSLTAGSMAFDEKLFDDAGAYRGMEIYGTEGQTDMTYRQEAAAYSYEYVDTTQRCDTPYYYTLLKPQPLPEFLRCGFRYTERCLTCTGLSTLVVEFKNKFPDPYDRAPVVDTVNVGDDTLQYNLLFERFMNFRTGYSYTWREYANAARNAECDLAAYATNSGSQSILCRNDHPLNDTTGIVSHEDPCQRSYDQSVSIATEIYKKRVSQLLADFETAYRAKCQAAGTGEVFTVSYDVKEYHYTLYYYDMAGNLVKTVPPRGVRPDWGNSATIKTKKQNNQSQPIDHRLPTRYNYNSLNQVVAQHTPDAGLSLFWYDRLGRLVVSQNAKQAAVTPPGGGDGGGYSYTLYDVLGRIAEVGEVTGGSAMTTAIAKDQGDLDDWMDAATSSKAQITKTSYDFKYINSAVANEITQNNLRNRVSWTALYNNNTDLGGLVNHQSATFYSYDIHGNVDTLLQDYKVGVMQQANGNRFKKLIYDYDLISGKVNMVSYQKGLRDGFYHRYAYDAENRLTDVYTSRDSIYWERDAQYDYYRHGPLSRTILGQQAVQGVDYVYTLQGWLKAINPSSPTGQTEGGDCAEGFAPETLDVTARGGSDPDEYKARTRVRLKEGFESGETNDVFDVVVDRRMAPCSSGSGSYNTTDGYPGSAVARDAYNVTLNYYEGDYKGIVAPSPSLGMAAKLGAAHRPLYNGNISSMAVNVPKLGTLGGTVAGAMAYAYAYDQLNRLVSMDAFKSSDENFNSISTTTDYREAVVYDPNGNILHYERNGNNSSTPLMDDMTYAYDYYTSAGVRKQYVPNQPIPGDADRLTNRLNFIDDAVGSGVYSGDIDDQNADNYAYDEIGNLTKDAGAGINANGIEWTVYGKISKITKTDGTVIDYTYDASGNRISKAVTQSSITKTTWYVRDASGNVIALYEAGNSAVNSGNLAQTEVHLYGSSRLGVYNVEVDVHADQDLITEPYGEGDTLYSFKFERGKKFFELSNHLGNVLVTVSDRKLQHSSDNNFVDYYLSDERSAQDYYPFGMLQVGRSWNAGDYRYGFNGKENDNEVSGEGNQYDYGFRIYNSRIGKFLSVDPLFQTYPWYTPYQFSGNSPIANVDLDGLEEENSTTSSQVKQVSSDKPAQKVEISEKLKKEAQASTNPANGGSLQSKPNPNTSVNTSKKKGTKSGVKKLRKLFSVPKLIIETFSSPENPMDEMTPEELYEHWTSNKVPEAQDHPGFDNTMTRLNYFNEKSDAPTKDVDKDEESKKNLYIHYTDRKGIVGIASTSTLYPNKKDKIYLTKYLMNEQDAYNSLFIANPLYKGKGKYLVVFMVDPDQDLNIRRDPQNPLEYIHNGGTLKIRPKNMLYIGPNLQSKK